MRMMGAATAIQLTWGSIDADMRAHIDHRIVIGLTVLLLILGMAGRIIKQDPPTNTPD